MHRSKRDFVNNYNHINIHTYKNCLYGRNKTKIENWIKHFLNYHKIKFNNLHINLWYFKKREDDETFVPTFVKFNVYDLTNDNKKWMNKLKLIFEENEVKTDIIYETSNRNRSSLRSV